MSEFLRNIFFGDLKKPDFEKWSMTSDTWRNLRIVFNVPSSPYWQYF